MKIHSPRNLRKRKTIRLLLIALICSVVALLLPRAVTLVTGVVMYPFHAVSVWVRDSDDAIPVFLRDRESLHQELQKLEDELRIAESNTVTEEHLLQENNRLRKLLGVATESRLAAAVIARPDELPYDLLQIDQGANAGVEVGAPVFAGRELAIGLVTHVAAEYSFVQLFTSPNFTATAFIAGPNVVANLEGRGGGVARVRVPQGIPLQVGNLVYIPSIEPGVFGRVTHVENVPTQAEQYGYVSPELAMSELHIVAVGRVSQISRDPVEIDQSMAAELAKSLRISGVPLGPVHSSSSQATSSEAVSTNEE